MKLRRSVLSIGPLLLAVLTLMPAAVFCQTGAASLTGYRNIDAVLAKRFSAGGSRAFEFRAEAFNLTNTPSFGPPARDINVPNTFGRITTTVSTARTVELVVKFFF